ncbi:MAG TPA: SAM-dependent chlorinase/fluorinase [Acidobacteriota bacterium]|nr:SAM-dependent chlorinase/fluorinase [Acidobacteriota bacterium]
MTRQPIVTFLSDFGTREYYVGAVKGAVLSACPEANVVDISHGVASHDLLEAAFTLNGAYQTFPSRTIHLVVVDPGVGSSRRALIVSTEKYYFVGPDNGVLSLIYQREEINRVISIEAGHYFREPVSPTFHGRDVFGPVAGSLAHGIQIDKFGPEVDDYKRLSLPSPRKSADSQVEGIVLHIDKFGNVITNLSPEGVSKLVGREARPAAFQLGESTISRHCRYYSEAQPREIISLVGSSGYYELAALKQPAARLLNAKRGAKVALRVE